MPTLRFFFCYKTLFKLKYLEKKLEDNICCFRIKTTITPKEE